MTLFLPFGAPLGPEPPFGSFPLFPQSPCPTSSRHDRLFMKTLAIQPFSRFFPTLSTRQTPSSLLSDVPFLVCRLPFGPIGRSVSAWSLGRVVAWLCCRPVPSRPPFTLNPKATDARENKKQRGGAHAQRPPFAVRFALFSLPPCPSHHFSRSPLFSLAYSSLRQGMVVP